MKNGLLYLTVVVLPLLGGLSCTKDDPHVPDAITLKFSRKALEYVQLNEGTRLVYLDSTTATLDTLMVSESTLDKGFIPTSVAPGFLGFPITFPAQNIENFLLKITKISGSQQKPWFFGKATTAEYGSSISSDHAVLVLSDITIKDSGNEEQVGGSFAFWEQNTVDLVTLKVEDKTYNDVVVYKFDNSYGGDINRDGYRIATYYWAKGIGIIKRRVITKGGVIKTYNLVSVD